MFMYMSRCCSPQVDPILELMTGRETLLMFARLRGMPYLEASLLVSRLLEQVPHMPITTHAHHHACTMPITLALN